MEKFNTITSRENSLIKLVSALQNSSSKRHENGLFVLEGMRICRDANENGIRFDKLIVSDTAMEKYSADISDFSENADECFKIPDSLFLKISDTKGPQGIIAVCAIPKTDKSEIKANGRYVGLEGLQDPSNLGAVARTAEALGVDGIILSADSCDPFSPKALRASMGTLLRMPIFIFRDFAKEIKASGLTSYACVVDKNAESINNVSFSDGCAVLIGNEGNGLTDSAKESAYKKITIPMSGRAESFNAAVATAIAVWEMMK